MYVKENVFIGHFVKLHARVQIVSGSGLLIWIEVVCLKREYEIKSILKEIR